MLSGFNFLKKPFVTEGLNLIQMVHPSHRILRSNLTDIAIFQQIMRQIYDGKSPWSYSIFFMELSPSSRSIYFKYLINQQVIGFIGIRIQGINAHITNLAISPHYQGQGYAKALLTFIVQYVLKKDCHEITLEVNRMNQRAIGLYEQFGFNQRGIKYNYYKRSGQDAIDMIYQLGCDHHVSVR